MKMAAAEALWETENPAALSLLTIGDEPDRRDVFAIRVSPILTYLVYGTAEGEVQGIKNLQAAYEQRYGPGDYVPPVAVTYWSFRTMVGAGFMLVLLSAVSLYLARSGRARQDPRFLRLLVLAIALPYVANTTGWLVAELGRQPWIVFGLMKTTQGVSATVPVSLL